MAISHSSGAQTHDRCEGLSGKHWRLWAFAKRATFGFARGAIMKSYRAAQYHHLRVFRAHQMLSGKGEPVLPSESPAPE